MSLRPQSSAARVLFTLDGPWQFQPDPDDVGEAAGWTGGLPAPRPIAVPASWNEQYGDLVHFFGAGWYQTRLDLPPRAPNSVAQLHIGSAFYRCDVWLDGEYLGGAEGGYLPAIFALGERARPGSRLVVRVDGRLSPTTVPSAGQPSDPRDVFASFDQQFPRVGFDFFPYCGIHRPVRVTVLPEHHLTDLTVVTDPEGSDGVRVRVRVERSDARPCTLRLSLCGQELTMALARQHDEATIGLTAPRLWSLETPTLHDLRAELWDGPHLLDSYQLPVGLRWVELRDGLLLLNGRPVRLRGFGKHEDFPISGRGLVQAVNVRDFDLLRWCGANSFRTTHYPYSEELLDLADQLGVLVIGETPAVGLWFGEGWERRLERCQELTAGLIARDKNRPSVIIWSLANEPMSDRPAAEPFFARLFACARALDPTRPLMLVSWRGVEEAAYAHADILGLNRYAGWYSEQGQIERGVARLKAELSAIHAHYGKPVMLTEFGAEAIPGLHAAPPEMFSEEYQAALIAAYLDTTEALPFVIGEHVWNFADFRANQHTTRVGGLNHKGVFTRDRRPKLGAHLLRKRWRGDTDGSPPTLLPA
ncbi:MAG: glycoside hydrolase family 2 protein [Chloroflexi bacterium OHK40]